jgi:homoserine O-succinyltransferase/O-acetyltransferase
MPVFVDSKSPDHPLTRAEVGNRSRGLSEPTRAMANSMNVGLINNMPDSALISTERQIFDLLNASAGRIPIRLRLYTLPMIPRNDWGRQYMGRHYFELDDLWSRDLDGIIVTGTEPRAPHLAEEPYWDALGKVIDWAKDHTISSVWSCLAVHSAVLYLDGIDRQQLNSKRIGIFLHTKVLDHPLVQEIPAQLGIPHSRWNEISEEALTQNGYKVLTSSADAGVDMFVKQQNNSLFVFFQGHLEYDAYSLLGEYRRDVGRFLRHEIEFYPPTPKGYFDHRAEQVLTIFQKRALLNRRGELLARFPTERVAANLKNSWHAAAKCIYGNWINYISDRKSKRSNAAIIQVRDSRASDSSRLLLGKSFKNRLLHV